MQANSGDPDQTPHSVASDLGLHYLSMSHKKDAMHICVKCNHFYIYGITHKYNVDTIFLTNSACMAYYISDNQVDPDDILWYINKP